MPTANIQETIPVFRNLLELYKKAKGDVVLEKWVNKSLNWLCRHLEEFVPVKKVSDKAVQEAARKNIGNISGYTWYQQTTKMRDSGRKIFHFEHVYPVSQMISDLKEIADKSDGTISDGDIHNVLNNVDIAWILKCECEKLDRRYKSKRPCPLRKAFDECNIKINWD